MFKALSKFFLWPILTWITEKFLTRNAEKKIIFNTRNSMILIGLVFSIFVFAILYSLAVPMAAPAVAGAAIFIANPETSTLKSIISEKQKVFESLGQFQLKEVMQISSHISLDFLTPKVFLIALALTICVVYSFGITHNMFSPISVYLKQMIYGSDENSFYAVRVLQSPLRSSNNNNVRSSKIEVTEPQLLQNTVTTRQGSIDFLTNFAQTYNNSVLPEARIHESNSISYRFKKGVIVLVAEIKDSKTSIVTDQLILSKLLTQSAKLENSSALFLASLDKKIIIGATAGALTTVALTTKTGKNILQESLPLITKAAETFSSSDLIYSAAKRGANALLSKVNPLSYVLSWLTPNLFAAVESIAELKEKERNNMEFDKFKNLFDKYGKYLNDENYQRALADFIREKNRSSK